MSQPFNNSLNLTLATAALTLTRYNTLVTDCNSSTFSSLMTGTITYASFTAAYNWLVNQLVTAGFTVADADQIAKAACTAYAAGYTSGVAGYGSLLAGQAASAAGLAMALGIVAMPGCQGECPTEAVASLSAALALVSYSIQVNVALTMMANMINLGIWG
jgi:hypothetical protein